MDNNLEVKITRQYFAGIPTATISLKGIIDIFSRSELDKTIERLLAENIYHYIFDLSGLQGIGSICLGLFIKIGGETREKSGAVVILNPSEEIKTVFRIIGLWEYINTANDMESAWRSFLPDGSKNNKLHKKGCII
ncbi:MAG: STAS domain-containing protein [Planctomycetota bacterium]